MIDKTENIVYTILKYKPRAREDDFILYGCVLAKHNVDLNTSLKDFLLNARKFNVPAFETVSRCRRKLQAKYPELIDTRTAEYREQARQEFRDYSKR